MAPTSFGQTLPLVMLIVPITDVWNDNYPLLEAKLRQYRLDRKKNKRPSLIPLASHGSYSSHGSGSRLSRSKYSSLDS